MCQACILVLTSSNGEITVAEKAVGIKKEKEMTAKTTTKTTTTTATTSTTTKTTPPPHHHYYHNNNNNNNNNRPRATVPASNGDSVCEGNFAQISSYSV